MAFPSEKAPTKPWVKWLRTGIALALAGVLLGFAFRGVELESVFDELSKANPVWVFAALFVSAGSHYLRAVRWRMLCLPLGANPTVSATFAATMVGYLANFAFPRLGEVSRCVALSRNSSLSISVALGTVVAERALDMICLVFLALGVFLWNLELIGGYVIGLFGGKLSAVSIWLWLGGGISLLLFISLIYWLVTTKNPRAAGVQNFLKQLGKGIRSLRQVHSPRAFVLVTALMWILYYFSTYFAILALPFSSSFSLNAGFIVLLFGSLGIVAPVQGGIGAYHFLVQQAGLLLGVTAAEGLAMGTLIHGLQSLLIFGLGLWGVIYTSLASKRYDETLAKPVL
jgi:hypothetical protein